MLINKNEKAPTTIEELRTEVVWAWITNLSFQHKLQLSLNNTHVSGIPRDVVLREFASVNQIYSKQYGLSVLYS